MNYFSEKKLMFSAVAAILYLVIASPPVYNFVGSFVDLNYDDVSKPDRHILLLVHGFVYFVATMVLVNVMTMPAV